MSSFDYSEFIRAKFDDGNPIKYSYVESETSDQGLIFIKSADSFINKLKASNKLMIEAPYFDEGRQVSYFTTENFKWEY